MGTVSSETVDEVARLERSMEELRHSTFGYFGPVLREQFQTELGWIWSPAHYRLLRAVEASHPVRPTLVELGGALLVDKARASRLVSELHAIGLVRRQQGRLDRRRREVELTDDGVSVLREARQLRRQFIDRMLAGWARDEVEHLACLIERFNDEVRDAGPIGGRT
jgi:DNA-binding MarR family transcriptional regulator